MSTFLCSELPFIHILRTSGYFPLGMLLKISPWFELTIKLVMVVRLQLKHKSACTQSHENLVLGILLQPNCPQCSSIFRHSILYSMWKISLSISLILNFIQAKKKWNQNPYRILKIFVYWMLEINVIYYMEFLEHLTHSCYLLWKP